MTCKPTQKKWKNRKTDKMEEINIICCGTHHYWKDSTGETWSIPCPVFDNSIKSELLKKNMINDKDYNINKIKDKELAGYLRKFDENKHFKSLNIVGHMGSGKTHILKCYFSYLIQNDISSYFINANDLVDLMRLKLSDTESIYKFNNMMNCKVILIDNFGSESITTEFSKKSIFNFFDSREGKTVFTSRRFINAIYMDKDLGLSDKIMQGCKVVVL